VIRNGIKKKPIFVVLYLHGGGYSVGGSPQYPSFFLALSEQCTAKTGVETRVFSLDYTLSNVAPVGTALMESCVAYDYLVHTLKIPPSHIIVGGDSAGGGLTLAFAHKCRDTKREMPAGLLLISPWVNIDPKALDLQTARHDYLTVKAIKEASQYYLSGRDATDPEASPMYASHKGLPPSLINYGGREVFRRLILQSAEKMVEDGVEVEYVTDPRMYHVYTCLSNMTKGAGWQDVQKLTDWMSKEYMKALK